MAALNATADINAVINYVNQAIANGTADIAPAEFYSLQLLETIRLDADQYVYFKQADSMPIQGKADKLTVRRWSALQAHTVPLTEGIPPISDKGSVKKYEMEAFQYGRYMEFTDKVDWKMVDPIVAHFSAEYSLVAMETLDMLARDALMQVAQVYYAGGVAVDPDDLTLDSQPSMQDLRKITLAMQKTLVKPRSNGKYLVIGSPEFFFDMFSDATVKEYMTINQSTYNMYGPVVPPLMDMFGMTFISTMCVPSTGTYVDSEDNLRLKYYKVVGETVTISTSTDETNACLSEAVALEYKAATTNYVNDPQTGMPASYIPGRMEWVIPTGFTEFKMQHIMILGKDALVRTGLAGQDQAKMYVKPLGSTGVLDPIDQRQSIGFKINSVGFASTRPEAVYDYICVPTMVNI